MKRLDLIEKIYGEVCLLIRHGAKHGGHQNSKTKIPHPVSRHLEIVESLSSHIMKELSD